MTKLEARRLQMLVNQREKLEDELIALESDILSLVRRTQRRGVEPYIRERLFTALQQKKPLSIMRR
jgi:hypothetical protein